MNLRKKEAEITELYRRGDFGAAKAGFEDLLSYLEHTEQTDQIEYWEALLGLGSLHQKDLKDLKAAEETWGTLVSFVATTDEALELHPEMFDVYTQALLLLALVQKDLQKNTEAEKNLRALREIAVEIRGEKSDDVKEIDAHLARLRY